MEAKKTEVEVEKLVKVREEGITLTMTKLEAEIVAMVIGRTTWEQDHAAAQRAPNYNPAVHTSEVVGHTMQDLYAQIADLYPQIAGAR